MIFTGDKITGPAKILLQLVASTPLVEGNAKFQLEVSANKMQTHFYFASKFMIP